MTTSSHKDPIDMPWGNVVNWVVKLGFPTVLAGVLVWSLVENSNRRIAGIESILQHHQIDTGYYVKANEEIKANQYRTLQILQQICVNGASLRDRPNCFR
jgi:hypothetical protein